MAKYVYKMVQIPPAISVEAKKHRGNEAAIHLQNIVNTYADEGWEFHRTDSFGVEQKPGCLAGLLGAKVDVLRYYVVTFRREV